MCCPRRNRRGCGFAREAILAGKMLAVRSRIARRRCGSTWQPGIAFRDSSMTASGLRNESRRARIVINRIAGKDYTTFAQSPDEGIMPARNKGSRLYLRHSRRDKVDRFTHEPVYSSATEVTSRAWAICRRSWRSRTTPRQYIVSPR
jgi:hypothetical protein